MPVTRPLDARLEPPGGDPAESAAGAAEGDLREPLAALHPAAFGWALACCEGDREEAEEVLQTGYLKVFAGRARFDGRSSLKTWWFAVLRRTASERRRRRAARRALRLRFARLAPDPPEVARPEAVPLPAGRRLERLLAALPARQREILHLVFYQDLTIAEAAAVAGIPVGTARTHYQRGKLALRRRLEREAER